MPGKELSPEPSEAFNTLKNYAESPDRHKNTSYSALNLVVGGHDQLLYDLIAQLFPAEEQAAIVSQVRNLLKTFLDHHDIQRIIKGLIDQEAPLTDTAAGSCLESLNQLFIPQNYPEHNVLQEALGYVKQDLHNFISTAIPR